MPKDSSQLRAIIAEWFATCTKLWSYYSLRREEDRGRVTPSGIQAAKDEGRLRKLTAPLATAAEADGHSSVPYHLLLGNFSLEQATEKQWDEAHLLTKRLEAIVAQADAAPAPPVPAAPGEPPAYLFRQAGAYLDVRFEGEAGKIPGDLAWVAQFGENPRDFRAIFRLIST